MLASRAAVIASRSAVRYTFLKKIYCFPNKYNEVKFNCRAMASAATSDLEVKHDPGAKRFFIDFGPGEERAILCYEE